MYFSQYKSGKKKTGKRNRFRDDKGIYGGIIRFTKLAMIVVSLIPAFYLIDRVYTVIHETTLFSHYFKVRSVKVKGNHFIAEEELTTLLKKVQGRNILTVDMQDMANRVKRHPWIKDVTVRRELPATLFVDIVERTPAVYLNSSGKLYLADEEGVILGDKTASLLNLPVVYGINLPDLKIGKKSPAEGLLSAIEVKKELNDIPWLDLSSTGIEVKERAQIVLHLKGYRIKLGRGRYKEKLDRFYDIAKNLQEKGVSYKEVDLRFDNQVIVNTVGT